MTLQNWNDDCEFYKRPSKKLVTNNDDLVYVTQILGTKMLEALVCVLSIPITMRIGIQGNLLIKMESLYTLKFSK
ncbi:hypothetical protein OUZ56_007051 [Daphnia magna]|uniref:Uncharacterized protein n=1 Tax=Daphnia magna TaxID=35525 RepID=A0ABQ9YXF9_9CRUS|nr:hypothetical protein OUZ56_007051 [Daphnia magna]